MKKIFFGTMFLCVGMLQAVDIPGSVDAELAVKTAELATLQASKLALKGELEAAKAILKGLEKSTGLVVEGTRAVLKAATSGIQITSAQAHAAPRELLEGKLPNLKIEMTVLGKKQTLDGFSLDLNNPAAGLPDLAKKIVDKVNIFN